MKVLHVYKTYLPDDFTGVPRVIHSIAQTLSARGVESHVLAPSRDSAPAEPLLIDGHHIHRVKKDLKVASTDISLRMFGHFKRLAASADVVHYHFPWPVGDLLYLLAGQGRPSLVTYHSDIVRQKSLLPLYSPLMHGFLSRVGHIVATSPNYAASSPVLQRYASKVTAIPIGIGPRPAVDPSVLQDCRNKVGEGFFLFVGAMRYYKGIEYLLDAARQSGLPVVLAGAVSDDLRFAGVPPNVRILGEVSEAEKEALLQLCQAFVLPSHLRSEAFGVSLLEAARAGRPMISCELGTGTTFVNLHNVTGLAVPAADAGALARAMMTMANAGEASLQMGKNAQARFEAMFTADAMATRYLALYRKLCGTA